MNFKYVTNYLPGARGKSQTKAGHLVNTFCRRGISFGFLMLFFLSGVLAGDLDKAFKYLNTGDYPNANKFLLEVLTEERDNAAANFGMAKYFSAKDNQAYNLDSANFFIRIAAKKIPFDPEAKQTKKFLTLGVRDYTIQALQKTINSDAYSLAEKQNTQEGYQHFIDHFTDATMLEQAIHFRNQKAYIHASSLHTPEALTEFIKKYPGAAEVKDAQEQYDKMMYEQMTSDHNFQSYKKYIDTYPNGPFVKEARKKYEDNLLNFYLTRNTLEGYLEFEKKYNDHPALNRIQDSIYSQVTREGTIEAFTNFVTRYVGNRNGKDAFNQLYILFTAGAKAEDYQRFLNYYPEFSDKGRVQRDIELSKLDLKPFQRAEKWGYVVQSAPDSVTTLIPFEYAEAMEFNCGYAAVREKDCTDSRCSYFYIDKTGHRVFPDDFNYAGNFYQGYAVVGLGNCEADSCKYGIIDKRGHFVVSPEFDEIGNIAEGYYMLSKEGKYGFTDQKGVIAIPLKYTDALSFSGGVAAVASDSFWFFIDTSGKQKFLNVFRDVSGFSDGLCAATQDRENWGYIDLTGNFVIQPLYEAAEDFENGYAIVSKKEKDPKNKSLFISQRYKIDKSGKTIEKLTAPKEPGKKKGKKKRKK